MKNISTYDLSIVSSPYDLRLRINFEISSPIKSDISSNSVIPMKHSTLRFSREFSYYSDYLCTVSAYKTKNFSISSMKYQSHVFTWIYQRFPRYRSSAEQYYFPWSFLKLWLELISFTLVRESYRPRKVRNDWLHLLLSHLFRFFISKISETMKVDIIVIRRRHFLHHTIYYHYDVWIRIFLIKNFGDHLP